MRNRRPIEALIASSLLLSLLGLSACGKRGDETAQQAPVSASAAAPQPASAAAVAYTPPTADQLYQMVAPIALFPDKLVALVLAGATYPDQITAANTWLTQNPSLKGQALVTAANQQSWDPSVKGLTAFPAVLSQMATNIAWTTTLGQAYYNDPTDVMNAIQVMRQRAQASGGLRTNGQIKVTQVSRTSAPADYSPAPNAPPVYEGEAVVSPPPQTIVIEPAQPDVVYVPSYDPAVVYGAPVPVYPGYVYHRPVYSPGAVVTTGAITFGVGVAVGAMFSHVGWGWHAWGMHWGGPHPGGPQAPQGHGWQRPAVVYNHTTYISKSTTVINRINNTHITNNDRTTVNNNTFVRNGAPPARAVGGHPPGPMTTPHFNARDAQPGARPQPQARPAAHPASPPMNAAAMHHAAPPPAHGNATTRHAEPEGHVAGVPQGQHPQHSQVPQGMAHPKPNNPPAAFHQAPANHTVQPPPHAMPHERPMQNRPSSPAQAAPHVVQPPHPHPQPRPEAHHDAHHDARHEEHH